MIATTTYVLCAVASAICAALLVRGFVQTRARLTLWCAICFVGLALNNAILVIDKATPAVDLSLYRTIPAFVGVTVLVFGLVWESR